MADRPSKEERKRMRREVEQEIDDQYQSLHLPAADMAFHESEYERLTAELEQARDESSLPDAPSARDGLNDLLLRVRGKGCTDVS